MKNLRKPAMLCLLICCLFAMITIDSLTQKSDIIPAEDFLLLTIGTADSGGTMYPVGITIADILSTSDSNLKVNLSASSGSSANVIDLQNGQIDLGLISGDVAMCAYLGDDEFTGNPATDLRAIAAVYSSRSNWIVSASSPIFYVHELKGKQLCLGPKNSTTDLSARIALDVLEINSSNSTFEHYGLGAGSTALKENKLDAVHGFAGIPISALTTLSEEMPTRLLRYTDADLSEILMENPSYTKMTIPAGTYTGQLSDIETFGTKCILSVDASMDDDVAYAITKLLMEAIPSLKDLASPMAEMAQSGFPYEDLTIPIHDGSLRYYQEQGLLPAN